MDNKINSKDPGIFKMILAICGRVLIIKTGSIGGASNKKKKYQIKKKSCAPSNQFHIKQIKQKTYLKNVLNHRYFLDHNLWHHNYFL